MTWKYVCHGILTNWSPHLTWVSFTLTPTHTQTLAWESFKLHTKNSSNREVKCHIVVCLWTGQTVHYGYMYMYTELNGTSPDWLTMVLLRMTDGHQQKSGQDGWTDKRKRMCGVCVNVNCSSVDVFIVYTCSYSITPSYRYTYIHTCICT